MTRFLLHGISFVLLLILAGCGPDPGENDQDPFVTLTDGLDRSIVIVDPPQRVVSIAPGATHIVRAAGGLSSLVGVTTADYEDDDLAHLPRISALPLDLEAVVALDPDLVLASDQVNDQAHAELFDALDIPIIYLGSDTWDDVRSSITMTGRVLDSMDRAEASADSLQQRLDDLVAVTSAIDTPPTAIFLVSPIRSYSFGQGSYVLDLMRWAGMDPLTDEFDTPAPVLDDEWVLLQNPDIIVGAFGEGNAIGDLLANHPTWRTLDAVKNGRVFNVPVPTILTPGPANIQAAWHMARAAHPDLFDRDPTP